MRFIDFFYCSSFHELKNEISRQQNAEKMTQKSNLIEFREEREAELVTLLICIRSILRHSPFYFDSLLQRDPI